MTSRLYSGTNVHLSLVEMKMEDYDILEAEDESDELRVEQGFVAGGDLSEQDGPQLTTKKRARPTEKTSKPRKKYVRGKQGSLKGLMQMPIDIFTEIANLLNPGDLIALARSSKFFRELLLQRSAIQMWRRAESNIPGLPPCPPDMCEPQYAALLFSKHCTLCGANATAKPDVYLRVRLCAICKENQIRDIIPWGLQPVVDRTLVDSSSVIKFKVDKSRPRGSRQPLYCLRQQVEEVLNKQREFKDAGDHPGLVKWEEVRRTVVSTRRKDGLQLAYYLDSVGKSRGRELDDVKQQRRHAILERLKALGWTDEDTSFSESDGKQWRAMVDVPKPLTDRIWDNILPKLIPLLEENRERHVSHAMVVRRLERRKHIDKFLKQMKREEHPLEPILNALGVHAPPALDSDDIFYAQSFEFENPFPNTSSALTWECLADLSEQDITLEEVQAELEARKAQIGQKVLEWRVKMERQLVERFEGEAPGDEDVVLTVRGDTELTTQLSRDLRLLLRADTIFTQPTRSSSAHFSGWMMPRDKDRPYYYPRFVSDQQEYFYEDEFTPQPGPQPEPSGQGFDFSTCQRHTELEKIVIPLLRNLGMPDVTHIELHALKVSFACGRCGDRMPKTWYELVDHYVSGLGDWARHKDLRTLFPTRHPIIYRNTHDLETQDNPKPLAKLLTEQESRDLLQVPFDMSISQPVCLVCYAISAGTWQMDPDELATHMQDVHDVSVPVEGVHYGSPVTDRFNEQWRKSIQFLNADFGVGPFHGVVLTPKT
ncbi:hypothetical protein FRC06_007902 [Ceratobasidium sp. 370]|nr:hypothetical protein FRC06_007902 [Ceratobasidium sp. 370]